MARKRFIFFRVLQSFLTKSWLQKCLLGFLTAIFCAIASPIGLSTTFRQVETPKLLATVAVIKANRSLLQQSKALYDTGQYIQSIELLTQAIAEFTSQSDRPNQALALSNLSLAYQQLGNWEAASQTISDSLQLLQDPTLAGRK